MEALYKATKASSRKGSEIRPLQKLQKEVVSSIERISEVLSQKGVSIEKLESAVEKAVQKKIDFLKEISEFSQKEIEKLSNSKDSLGIILL